MEVVKRLEFYDTSLQLAQMSSNESQSGTSSSAIAILEGKLMACGPPLERRVQEVSSESKDKACGAGSSDLRRLKRQFSSLKNTFILYDVKEGFIDGLRDGHPDGKENACLAEVEAEMETHGNTVKDLKASNTQVEQELLHKVSALASDFGVFQQEHADCLQMLHRIARETAERATTSAPVDVGEELLGDTSERLSYLAHEARDLENKIAARNAEAGELESAIASEEEHIQAMQSEVRVRGSARIEGQAHSDESTGWCQMMLDLVSQLGNIRVDSIEGSTMSLRMGPIQEHPGAQEASAPLLVLHFLPDSAEPVQAKLLHSDLDIQDILEETIAGRRPLSFLVREVAKRLNC